MQMLFKHIAVLHCLENSKGKGLYMFGTHVISYYDFNLHGVQSPDLRELTDMQGPL